jgi:hypothetical protein
MLTAFKLLFRRRSSHCHLRKAVLSVAKITLSCIGVELPCVAAVAPVRDDQLPVPLRLIALCHNMGHAGETSDNDDNCGNPKFLTHGSLHMPRSVDPNLLARQSYGMRSP